MSVEDGLTFAQIRELGVGPEGDSVFADDAERRRGWEIHQAHVESFGGYRDSWARRMYGTTAEEPEAEMPRQVFSDVSEI